MNARVLKMLNVGKTTDQALGHHLVNARVLKMLIVGKTTNQTFGATPCESKGAN